MCPCLREHIMLYLYNISNSLQLNLAYALIIEFRTITRPSQLDWVVAESQFMPRCQHPITKDEVDAPAADLSQVKVGAQVV